MADPVIDHIEFFVADATASAAHFTGGYGFQLVGLATDVHRRTATVRQGAVTLLFTQARTDEHPAAAFTQLHGDGVARIVFRVPDAAAALRDALDRGAVPADGGVRAFGDVVHAFVTGEAPAAAETSGDEPAAGDSSLTLDHIAVCLENGQLGPAVEAYGQVFGWQPVFRENIHVGAQAMESVVVQSPDRQVTLTFLQPMSGAAPGQIDDFLKGHGGSGVQHLAFAVSDIVRAVGEMGERGVLFLSTPASYYTDLPERLSRSAHSVEALSALSILADQDHDGQLFQIFTRSAHPRNTFFMEIIERQGARTFGSNNIRKLYEAIERGTTS